MLGSAAGVSLTINGANGNDQFHLGAVATGNLNSLPGAVTLQGQVGTDTNWASADAAFGHTVAVRTDGTLWTWGLNDVGQLGDGTTTSNTSPVQIGSDTNWKKVAVNDLHTIATRTDNTLWAWGANDGGQLGDGTNTGRTTPAQVGTGSTWSDISAGGIGNSSFSVGTQIGGSVWVWGRSRVPWPAAGMTTFTWVLRVRS